MRASKNESLVQAVLDDWRKAPVESKLRSALAFLEKLTLDPASVTATDITPMRAQGLSDAAIEDAIHVCTLFNIYDRLADSFEFDIPDESAFATSASMLLKRGYT